MVGSHEDDAAVSGGGTRAQVAFRNGFASALATATENKQKTTVNGRQRPHEDNTALVRMGN